MVRVFPLDLFLGPTQTRVGGIGSVGTSPAMREHGCMSRLMDYALCAMQQEGLSISVLWGDRHRYRSFGYERAGMTVALTITRRGIKKIGISDIEPSRYLGQTEVLRGVVAAYEAHSFRRIRTPGEYEDIYRGFGTLLFYAGEGRDFGYLVLGRNASSVVIREFGGHEQTVLGLAGSLMKVLDLSCLEFPFPGGNAIPPLFADASAGVKLVESAKIRIIDLDRTIAAFQAQAKDNVTDPDYIRNLDPAQQVEALFGLLKPGPFTFFMWDTDCV